MPGPFLALLGFVAFVIAGILELVKKDPKAIIWLIIVGGLLVCASVAFSYWDGRRSRGVA